MDPRFRGDDKTEGVHDILDEIKTISVIFYNIIRKKLKECDGRHPAPRKPPLPCAPPQFLKLILCRLMRMFCVSPPVAVVHPWKKVLNCS
jgi:hypothetical protein